MINSDGVVVEEGDCPTTDDDNEMDRGSDVVWAKSAQGTWRIGYTFGDKVYFTRDIPEEKGIPKNLVAPTVSKHAKQPAAKPAAVSSQCIENSAYLHHVHDTISIYACPRASKSCWQPTASK